MGSGRTSSVSTSEAVSGRTSSEAVSDNFKDTAIVDWRYTGRVKWFNVKHGYGFITPVKTHGEQLNEDIFVHHTSITVGVDQYKYLTEGEYVDFNLEKTESGDHEYHAVDVTGIAREFLLCETRFAALEASKKRKNENQRAPKTQSQTDDFDYTRAHPSSPKTPRGQPDDFEYPRQKRTFAKKK